MFSPIDNIVTKHDGLPIKIDGTLQEQIDYLLNKIDALSSDLCEGGLDKSEMIALAKSIKINQDDYQKLLNKLNDTKNDVSCIKNTRYHSNPALSSAISMEQPMLIAKFKIISDKTSSLLYSLDKSNEDKRVVNNN